MFKRLFALILVAAMVFTLAITGCGKTEKSPTDSSSKTGGSASASNKTGNSATKKVKVGFVYVGPVNDGGWTQAHDNGRKYLAEKLGVETLYKESVNDQNAEETRKAIENLIDQGCNVIFTTSFGFMDPTYEEAQAHPDVKFFHCSGYKTADNMSTYFGKIEEPRYLSGIVAGLKTKSNKIGYVAATNIPEVIRGINAFTLGVQSVNPDAKVIVKWSNTWIDEVKEKETAIALLDEGCDVIAQHNDSTAPQKAAEERGAFAIGYDLDNNAAPKAYMTAPIFNWGPYYVEQVKAIMDGTWKSSSYWGNMKDGIVDLAPITSVAPEGAAEKVEAVKKQMLDGTFTIFKGPLKDQSGNVRVPEGSKMSDKEIWEMNWFIQGVEGNAN